MSNFWIGGVEFPDPRWRVEFPDKFPDPDAAWVWDTPDYHAPSRVPKCRRRP